MQFSTESDSPTDLKPGLGTWSRSTPLNFTLLLNSSNTQIRKYSKSNTTCSSWSTLISWLSLFLSSCHFHFLLRSTWIQSIFLVGQIFGNILIRRRSLCLWWQLILNWFSSVPWIQFEDDTDEFSNSSFLTGSHFLSKILT